MSDAEELVEIEKLIENGFDVNSTDESNSTLLHYAARYGDFALI